MENLLETCRICLDPSDNLTPLSTIVYQNLSPQEMFNTNLSAKVTEDDKLPKNVCGACIDNLIIIHNFHQKYEETQRKLEDVYRTSITDNLDVQLHDISEHKLSANEKLETSDFLLTDYEDNLSNNDSISAYLKLDNKGDIVRENNQEKSYKCGRCKETFTTDNDLQRHKDETQHKDIRNHACEICKKRFTRSKLKQHMRVHTQERPYKCKLCAQSFSFGGNLKRHMMTHTGERPHICEVCGKAFIQSCTLLKHQKTHGPNDKNLDQESHYKCKICGRLFKRLARYNTHITKHSNTPEQKTIPIKHEETNTENYTCDICQNSYKSKVILKAHYLTHGEKSYLCSHCGKGFVTKSALQSHLMVHTGERPHICAICKKAFAHIGTFEKHLLTHTGQKPYVCQICGKSFSQYAHVKHHLRTHTGERPYVCPYCDKAFASKGNLTVHVRIHTGETPYLCPVCGRGYYDSTSMKRHWKGHSN